MFRKKIGIDLGTANTVVFVPGKGFIINEPTIVALTRPDNTVLAVGAEAKEMIGRTPDEIVAYRPLKDGVIADYYITKAMLHVFHQQGVGIFQYFEAGCRDLGAGRHHADRTPRGHERRARSGRGKRVHRARADPRRLGRGHPDQRAIGEHDREHRRRHV